MNAFADHGNPVQRYYQVIVVHSSNISSALRLVHPSVNLEEVLSKIIHSIDWLERLDFIEELITESLAEEEEEMNLELEAYAEQRNVKRGMMLADSDEVLEDEEMDLELERLAEQRTFNLEDSEEVLEDEALDLELERLAEQRELKK